MPYIVIYHNLLIIERLAINDGDMILCLTMKFTYNKQLILITECCCP